MPTTTATPARVDLADYDAQDFGKILRLIRAQGTPDDDTIRFAFTDRTGDLHTFLAIRRRPEHPRDWPEIIQLSVQVNKPDAPGRHHMTYVMRYDGHVVELGSATPDARRVARQGLSQILDEP